MLVFFENVWWCVCLFKLHKYSWDANQMLFLPLDVMFWRTLYVHLVSLVYFPACCSFHSVPSHTFVAFYLSLWRWVLLSQTVLKWASSYVPPHGPVWGSLGFPDGSAVKNLPVVQEIQEMRVRFLGWKNPPEEETATHSSILAWKIPWTEEPGRLQSKGS